MLGQMGPLSGLCGNRLVGVVGLAVREEVVDDHADNRKEEHDESPDDLVGHGAVRLEDLNCSTDESARLWQSDGSISRVGKTTRLETSEGYLLHAMMSRTRTMNPTMPPPVPACHGSAFCTVRGAASASMNMESWRSRESTMLNMFAVLKLALNMSGSSAECKGV